MGSEVRFIAKPVSQPVYLTCPQPHNNRQPLTLSDRDTSNSYQKFIIKAGTQGYTSLRFDSYSQPYICADGDSVSMQTRSSATTNWSLLIFGRKMKSASRFMAASGEIDLTWSSMKDHELLVGMYNAEKGKWLGVEKGRPMWVELGDGEGDQSLDVMHLQSCLWQLECVDHNLSMGQATMVAGLISLPFAVVAGAAAGVLFAGGAAAAGSSAGVMYVLTAGTMGMAAGCVVSGSIVLTGVGISSGMANLKQIMCGAKVLKQAATVLM
ncbi:hypothetical protein HDU98_003643 [Podochytrium sp. JEL0797]|nr:hypothetical protein HDU98_003643 [Podochytrium sp. JEL0797]